MSKPKFNLYSIINNYNEDYNELYEFIQIYGEMALHTKLKVGKLNYPLVEAIQKNKPDAFDIILKALPLEVIASDNDYLNEIVYSIKKQKIFYYYNEFLNKIQQEDPNNQLYYSNLIINLVYFWSNKEIQFKIDELFNNPLFNVQQFFNNNKLVLEFIHCIAYPSKPGLLSLIQLFEKYNINQNYLFNLIYVNWFKYSTQVDYSNSKKQRQEMSKFCSKRLKLIDLERKGSYTHYKWDADKITLHHEYSFRLFLLFYAFPDIIKHYDTEFNPELIDELIELCKDDYLIWHKKFSIFSPINDLNFLVNNYNPETPPNFEKLYKTLVEYKELIEYFKEIKEYIYKKENSKFLDFILEILTKIKEIINNIFGIIENNDTNNFRKDLFIKYIDELIEQTKGVFN